VAAIDAGGGADEFALAFAFDAGLVLAALWSGWVGLCFMLRIA